jgi:peptidoglycan/xylan/chitin deacetylase (PgdA/CDA1 family)
LKINKALFIAVFSFLPIYLFGVNFSDLNLSNDDRLLFRAEFESQNAVFISTLNNMSIQQMTAFPEKLQVVDNGRTIQAVNRFGVARISVTGGLPVPLPGYPSFAEGGIPLKGRLQEVAASNDGRWVLYIEPTSPAYGTLFLINVSNGRKQAVSERVELPARDFPAKWSPDSRLFVYSKDGRLYYFPIISNLSVLVDERFRMMGAGSINSVAWGQQGDFFYFSGNTLYQVRNPELFTRTIYGDFFSIGNTAAVLPFEFDPSFDHYWVAPNSESILLNKNNKGLFVFLLGNNNRSNSNAIPYVSIPSGADNMNVLWNSGSPEQISILFSENNRVAAWRYTINANQSWTIVTPENVPLSSNGALSPDGTRAIFWGEKGLELWDFTNWRLIQKLKDEPILSCAWINNGRFISGTYKQIEEINISAAAVTQRRICLSGADEIGLEASARGRVFARLGSDWYATDTRNGWTVETEPQLRPVSLATDRFRVYLEPQSSGLFRNIPMIRNVQSIGTTSLMAKHTVSRAYPQRNFTRIALCFDLYDDDTGLYHVLAALRRNNIRATFFLNGEFIRRNPQSAAAIAEAGHETASMFYAPIDFSDSRYRITREFITQGLARNEDEFFNSAGRELVLLWHPPFYRNSSLITSSAAAAGYTTINRTLDLHDWVSREESGRLNLRQISASQMIEQVVDNRRMNAIIPVRIGLLSGGRDEYLYQRIDVLLDALVRCGIDVIPVSAAVR